MDPEVVKRQLSDLYSRGGASLQMLLSSGACVQEIIDWTQRSMRDEAPSLAPLQALLATMTSFAQNTEPMQEIVQEWQDLNPPVVVEQLEIRKSEMVVDPFIDASTNYSSDLPISTNKSDGQAMGLDQQREHIRQLIAQVRSWVEQNEPSSPVAVLLKQAERLWGKRFAEVAHAIPADLLKSWDDGSI
jgi:type VI secretion system protein ImpA